ncbi:TPA: hypothetical protein DEA21_01615 [Candidatus Uhrbacteria bacterium]|nr:hypothetical protein [Candidatus Uhrbacteria bacterium]
MPKRPESDLEIPLQERKNIGERILGVVDPKGISRAEFEKSPNLLFHGSSKPFEFRPVFDYRSESYIREQDGSTTLGFGFYTSDSREEASQYSRVRQGGKPNENFITPILPFKARVLDLRWKDDQTRNAPFPPGLVEAWRVAFFEYFRNRKPREGNVGMILDSSEVEYATYLERVTKLKAVDLRTLLETAPAPEVKSRNLPSPYWAILFSEFMLAQGYDGLVYNEGGEGWKSHGPSYVFYNLLRSCVKK